MNLHGYMEIAKSVAQLSKDDTKVGALVVGASKEIRSMGYNGAPRNCSADEPGDERWVKPEKAYWVSHAELNAITNAARVGVPLEGCSIFVTHQPCMECARAIVQSGIRRVVVAPMDPVFMEKWGEHLRRSRALFDECGVELVVLE